MTGVTNQRQEWARGGRVLCGPLGKVEKKGQLQERWSGGITVKGQNTLKGVITSLRVKFVLWKCLVCLFKV
jgi:hypothetical protein